MNSSWLILVALMEFFFIGACANFSSEHSSEDVLTFLLLGDWGKGGTSGTYGSNQKRAMTEEKDPSHNMNLEGGNNNNNNNNNNNKDKNKLYQMQVATAMGNYSMEADPKPSFLIALGDNFYDNGVTSSTDSLWQYLWKDVYLRYEELNIPWYPVFGNHDYGYGETGVQAQINRYKDHTDDDIWMFESRNYTKRFTIPGERGGSVCVIFIDTTTLAPSVNRCCNENGGISTAVQQARIVDQLTHINEMLTETVVDPPTWLIVAGHYPVFSAGAQQGDVSEMMTYLLPLLKAYNVHAYLCGHDHIAEHLQYSNYTTEFFVVGAGTMTDSIASTTTSAAELLWSGAGYASFASMNATADDLTIQFRNTTGAVQYSYVLTNPNVIAPPTAAPTVAPTATPTVASTDNNSSTTTTESPPAEGTVADSGKESNYPVFSYAFWSETASNASSADIAMASGGVAAMGLIVFLCYSMYRRTKRRKREQATSKFLDQARSNPLHQSPNRLRRHNSHGSDDDLSNKSKLAHYVELMELGEADDASEEEEEAEVESDAEENDEEKHYSGATTPRGESSNIEQVKYNPVAELEGEDDEDGSLSKFASHRRRSQSIISTSTVNSTPYLPVNQQPNPRSSLPDGSYHAGSYSNITLAQETDSVPYHWLSSGSKRVSPVTSPVPSASPASSRSPSRNPSRNTSRNTSRTTSPIREGIAMTSTDQEVALASTGNSPSGKPVKKQRWDFPLYKKSHRNRPTGSIANFSSEDAVEAIPGTSPNHRRTNTAPG